VVRDGHWIKVGKKKNLKNLKNTIHGPIVLCRPKAESGVPHGFPTFNGGWTGGMIVESADSPTAL